MAVNRKHHAVDTATSERWALLGLRLRARRIELGYPTRVKFAEARGLKTARGNPNVRMINAMENNERAGSYAPGRLEQFARAYEVTSESVYALLDGKADELTPAAPVPAEPLEWRPPMSDPVRISSGREHFDEINERRVALAARGITDPSGTQMFPDAPGDAQTWDGIGLRLPLPDRVWLIADLRRRAAGLGPSSGSGGEGA